MVVRGRPPDGSSGDAGSTCPGAVDDKRRGQRWLGASTPGVAARDGDGGSGDSTGTRPVTAPRRGRFRRLLADLGRPENADRRGQARPAAGRCGGPGRHDADRRQAGWRQAGRGDAGGATPQPTDRASAAELARQERLHRGEAALAEAIARGEPLERAVCGSVTELIDADEWNPAWAMAEGVGRLAGGATHRRWGTRSSSAGAACSAVSGHWSRGWTTTSSRRSSRWRRSTRRWPPGQTKRAGAHSRSRRRWTGCRRASSRLAGRFLAFGEPVRAGELVAELRQRSSLDLDDRRRRSWQLIEGWLAQRPVAVPQGSIPVAILDYQTPDHVLTSGNLGDYVQTLALLGNLARLSDVAFTGDDGLGTLATELQARVQPSLRRPGATGAVHLLGVDRDFSNAEDVPPGTWMVAFGWHMHPLYDLRYDFPYHPNIRPLFLSFHLNRLDMLSDEATAYLRAHGPIGCRDWNTVFLLLSAGIDAFFTGCLTTTVDAVFPAREAAWKPTGAVGVIDLPQKAAGRGARNVRLYTHQSEDVRHDVARRRGPGGDRAPDGIPAAPRSGGHRPAARLPPADVTGRAGRVQGGEPGRRALRRPDRPAPGRRAPDGDAGRDPRAGRPHIRAGPVGGRGGRCLRRLARPHPGPRHGGQATIRRAGVRSAHHHRRARGRRGKPSGEPAVRAARRPSTGRP